MTELLSLPMDIVEADLSNSDHQKAVVDLVDSYAMDSMGQGGPLSPEVREALIPALKDHPTTMIFLAYHGGRAVGIALCFRGFSTFMARPLINIHDLAVLPAYRGRGISLRLLEAVEKKARSIGCCKLTLEVLAHNNRARRVYETAGFKKPRHQGGEEGSFFLGKEIEGFRAMREGGE